MHGRKRGHHVLDKINAFRQTTLGSIVGARGSCLTSALSGSRGANEKRYGSIKILAEEIPSNAVRDSQIDSISLFILLPIESFA